MAEFIGAVVDQHGGEDVQLVPRAAAPASFIGGGEGADLAPRGTSFRHAGAEQWQRARPSRRIQHAYKGAASPGRSGRRRCRPRRWRGRRPRIEPASARRLASTGAAAEEVQGSAAGDRGAHQELGVKASDLHRDDRRFIKLQAILTVLPQHLLGWTGSSPGSEGKRGGELTHADLVEAALVKSCLDYPRFAKVLGRLVVAHASQDMAILVDHEDFQEDSSRASGEPILSYPAT
ncbi:unnamed protein product [Prorocentrum cordatum]|uniref:Uncharacterized protein n=1 Tax=Prorocentrum cordatum TaxID=2364126 RepID=A0ABN9Q0M4_9DINO|nr:unnamed protein product [Polarella glacialis]